MMKTVQHYLRQWRTQHFSILIIPHAGATTKQIRVQALALYGGLFLVISAGIFFSLASIALIHSNFFMQNQNHSLSGAVAQREKDLEQLNKINQSLRTENDTLKNSTSVSTDYFNRRVSEINELQGEVDTLLTLFNKQNHSNIKMRTDRSAPELKKEMIVAALSNHKSVSEVEASDKVAAQMRQEIAEYRRVIQAVEKELELSSCKPDAMPLRGLITSTFGYREDPMNFKIKPHDGIDIDGNTGDPVGAAGAGTVTYAAYSGSYGNMVIINHGSGYESVYAHLSEIAVVKGQQVQKKQRIGRVGSTGISTGSHLHFEVHFQGHKVNPLSCVQR